jgi:hypothetical protein
MSQSKYNTYQQASLSQKVSANIPLLKKLSGSDTELSDSIAVLSYLGEKGLMDKKDTEFILGLLDVLRLSHFATSEKINEITKLGFMLPKGEAVISDYDEEA